MIIRKIDTIKNVPAFLIKHYTKRLKKKSDPLLFLPLANALRLNGQLEKALEICEQGLEIHPEYASARVMFGLVYLESEMIDEAEVEFKKALKLNDKNLKARKMLYNIYLEKGDDIAAFAQLEKIVKIYPLDKNLTKEFEELKGKLTEEEKEKVPGEIYIDSSGIYEKTEERKREIVKKVRELNNIRTYQTKRFSTVKESSSDFSTQKTIELLETWLTNIKQMQKVR